MNDVIRTAFEKEDREEKFLFNFRKSLFSKSIESILTYVMRF